MNTFRPKVWTSVGAALLLSVGGVAACTKTEKAEKDATATPAVPAGPASGEAGETAGGEGGGGEAGAGAAYAGVPASSRTALRLAHLKGFLLAGDIALKTEGAEAAGVLIGQGVSETFDHYKDVYQTAGVDEAVLRAASEKGDAASIKAALANVDAAVAKAGGEPGAVIKGMVEIASGLYGGVVVDGGVDTTEYQHSHGAALAAKGEFDRSLAANPKLGSIKADLDGFLALWPTPQASEDPAKLTPVSKVTAQASRIELALSSL